VPHKEEALSTRSNAIAALHESGNGISRAVVKRRAEKR
jgi:hypothetical protein